MTALFPGEGPATDRPPDRGWHDLSGPALPAIHLVGPIPPPWPRHKRHQRRLAQRVAESKADRVSPALHLRYTEAMVGQARCTTRRYASLLSALAIVVCSLAPHRANAQVSHLDKAMLIERLAKEGMTELLLRLVETEPSDDPVIDELIRIAQLRIRYDNTSRDDYLAMLAAYNQLTGAMRALIQRFPDHEQRPLWQTDLAELQLLHYLGGLTRHAAEFYEFGVPSRDQRQAFEETVPRAFADLVDAELRFFQLQTELPRQPDHVARRVNTALWDRMINEYFRGKTPFLLAHAAYYTSLLPDTNPYYTHLPDPRIPRQKTDPRSERLRLLDLALQKLRPLASDVSDPLGVRIYSRGLIGRVMLHQPSQATLAIEEFDAAANASRGDVNDLLCQLGKAMALNLTGQSDRAMGLLEQLRSHPVVSEDLLRRLLVVDRMHLQMLAVSPSSRPEAVAESYKPYERLLEDATLGDTAEGLRNYIFARWESTLDDQTDPADLPTTVLEGVAEISRMEGQNLAVEAERLASEDQPQAADSKYAQSQPKLERTVRICTELLSRGNLTASQRARAMFNQATAVFFLARGDFSGQINAAKTWTDLADQLPDQPAAEQAIGYAVGVLRQLQQLTPRPEGVTEAYARTVAVLFEKYPTSKTADNERLYYAASVLIPRGAFSEAAEVLSKIPAGHPDYFAAQRERLLATKEQWAHTTDPAEKDALLRQLTRAVKMVLDTTASPPAGTPDEQLQVVHNTRGWAKLVEADIALAQDHAADAAQALEGFEDRFQDDPDLIREALARRVLAQAHSGQFGRAVDEAKTMMLRFSDEAAPVIDEVLTDLDQRIDALRKRAADTLISHEKAALEKKSQDLASAAEMLAQLLLDWATAQQYTEDELVPFHLILIKAMRLAGKPDGAVQRLRPLLEDYPDDSELIHHMGESLFAIGSEPALLEAAGYYDRLINGMAPPYPSIWWNAWLRRLQIMAKLNQSIEDIPLCIRSLKLTDPNLGGEPYLSEFNRLAVRYGQ